MSHWVQHKCLWFPGKGRVCGRRLRPLTLGHLRLLEIIESPFLGGGSVGIEELSAAVAIVAAPLWLARHLVGHKWLLMLAALPIAVRWQKWQDEAAAFEQYMADNQWMPERYSKGNEINCNVFGYSSSFSMRMAWMMAERYQPGVPVKTHPVWRLTVMECLAWRLTEMELNGGEYVTRDEVETTNAAVAEAVAAEAAQNQTAVA